MDAVSDTSVLNYLAIVGRFELLREQFEHVIVPGAVLGELDARPDLPGAERVRQAAADGWIEIALPQDTAMVRLLREDLGPGESEAIVLAVQRSAAFVLIDETEGRQRALAIGIPVVGTIGVLLKAKKDGSLRQVQPVLHDLVNSHHFRLDASLLSKVLMAAGESVAGS